MGQSEITIILGSGASVKHQGVDVSALQQYGHVIGVNDSGIFAPCHEIISMDRLWMEARIEFLKKNKMKAWLRWAAYRVNLKSKEPWDGLEFFNNDYLGETLSDLEGVINGFNSGFCALNLAYKRKPHEIFLFGFDHKKDDQGNPYWHEPYPWARVNGSTGDKRYVEWSKKYEVAAFQLREAGIAVYNVSPQSAINVFDKLSYGEFLACVKSA